MDKRAFTVRLPEDKAEELERVAKIDNTSVAEQIREAISELIEKRRQDPEFQNNLKRLIKEDQKILDRLAK